MDGPLRVGDEPSAAAQFRRRAEKELRRLEQFPDFGRVISVYPDLPYRKAVVAHYRFFYRVKGKTVLIVGIWHSAQVPRKSSAD